MGRNSGGGSRRTGSSSSGGRSSGSGRISGGRTSHPSSTRSSGPHQAEGYPPAAAARDPRAVLTEAVLLTDRGITVHHQRLILRPIPTRHRITAGMTTTILHREATVIPMEAGDTVQAAVSACALRWW